MHIQAILASVLFVHLSASPASVVIGNPTSEVSLVAGSSVYVHSLEASRCSGGSQVISIRQVVSSESSASITFDEDEFCSIALAVKWTPTSSLVSVGVGGFTSFKAVTGGSSVSVGIDASAQTAVLQ